MNTLQRIPITPNGISALREQLNQLKHTERPAISDAIARARALGDLKENAEYHAAKDQQGLIEAKISKLEDTIGRAQVIDVTKMKNEGKVIFGSTVTLENINTDEEKVFTIVGESEADVNEGKISVTSPIARAVVGKWIDEVVTVNAPSGPIEYTILSVRYGTQDPINT